MVTVRFRTTDGTVLAEAEAPAGARLLHVAQDAGMPLEGACEGAMACSTCHVILDVRDFHRLPPPREEEEDMLDYAFGATATSRLACQIWLTDDQPVLDVIIPGGARNLLNV
ncbi:MAG: 2Fe-2S iron-sulfur cluster binding domain-containing protein [Sphingomonadales bacterium]|nr:MAG: 2Fe-2S iron-sulfur cluster binding domain-containing protein [Sphingomonadales bacterium]